MPLVTSEMINLDYHMGYLPFGAWFLSAIAFKFVNWELTGGQAVWGCYGKDKGLASVIVEFGIVYLLFGLYLARFPTCAGERPDKVRIIARRYMIVVVALSVLVAIAVPPLPD